MRVSLNARTRAVLELMDRGELAPLAEARPWTVQALADALDDMLAWHRAHGEGPRVWCGACGQLVDRRHKCAGVGSG
jgi:hypothetical protein